MILRIWNDTDFELNFFCELTPASILDNVLRNVFSCNYPRRWNAGAVAEKNFVKVYHPKSCRLEKHIFLTKQHPVSVYIRKSSIAENLSREIDAVSSSGGRDESASMIRSIFRKMFDCAIVI